MRSSELVHLVNECFEQLLLHPLGTHHCTSCKSVPGHESPKGLRNGLLGNSGGQMVLSWSDSILKFPLKHLSFHLLPSFNESSLCIWLNQPPSWSVVSTVKIFHQEDLDVCCCVCVVWVWVLCLLCVFYFACVFCVCCMNVDTVCDFCVF